MKLNFQQKKEMLTNGYVHLKGVIPKAMVDRALQHINHSLGASTSVDSYGGHCQEITGSPVITELITKTPYYSLVESLLGTGNVSRVGGAQIALRFPSLQDPPSQPHPHLDGMHTPTNGVAKGTIGNFTALAGLFLSDIPNENSGNFTVWPGSHHLYEQYFKEHGPESLLKGMPKVDLPAPKQITATAGDIIICHYLLAHGVAANVSPNIRYALFYRIFHTDLGTFAHRSNWQAPMKDLWLHWPGIQEII